MKRSLAVSPFLTGDPVRLGPEITTIPAILETLGIDSPPAPGLLPLPHRVALIHSLTGEEGGLAVRWVDLPHAPAIAPGGAEVEVAVVVTAPIRESGPALRLLSR